MPVSAMRRSFFLVAILLLPAAFAIVPWMRADGDPAEDLLDSARDAMIRRDYGAAETVLSGLIRDFPSTSAAAEGRVLRGRALIFLGKTDEAVRDLSEAVARLDEASVWRRHARFLLAEIVSNSGKTGESATIYLDEARSIQSLSSRDELAARFEALADEFSRKRSVKVGPLVETIEPDYGTAATLYDEALRMAASKSAEARLFPRIAESHFLGGNFGAAIAVAERFFAESRDRESDVDASTLARLRYVAGRAYLRSDRAADARRVFEALATSAAARSDEFAELEIWLAESIAAIGDGSTMLSEIEHYDRFLSAHPTHPRAEEVLRAKIERQKAAGLSSEAEATCRTYLDRFARQPAAPGVLETIAELRLSRNEHDAARAALTEFLEKYPDDARVPKIQARLPEVMLVAGRHAVATKNYEGAIAAFQKFLETYPAHPSSPNAAVEIGRLQHRLGQFDAARRSWSGAQDRYRESNPEEASTAGFLLGALIEETDKKLAEAAEQYRRVAETFSGRGGGRNASLRLSALTQEVLELEAPKIVATSESPTVRLSTRNIPFVVVKVHRLDLSTYFRAKHRTEGFEDLDTTLIRPDSEWKYEVPNYEPYRSDSVALPIKLPPSADSSDSRPSATAAPGCYLVTVDDGKRKSLAALIVSDLRLIVKSSARQIFVAAIDVSAKTTVEGVDVLVSDGRTIVAEGKTGADGVFVRDFAAPASDRRVLAVLGRHATPGCVVAAPPEVPAGYLPKVRIATDRAVYQPGDAVRYRLLARAVDRGDYKVPPSGETIIVKFMNAGRTFDEAKVTLNSEGSADGTFGLSPDAPLGEYSVEADWAGAHFSAAIAVKTYTRPSIVVGVKVPNAEGFAVRPGDEVATEIDVADFFGAPIADARIRWSIFESAFRFDAAMLDEFAWYENAVRPRTDDEPSSRGRLIAEGETIADPRGRAAIKFRTNSVGANEYLILVRAETEDLSPARGVGRIVAAPQSFFGHAKTDRRAYRSGDKMTVDLSTVGPDFTPVASSGELFLLAKETGGGEREIAKTSVATGPNGRGIATFIVPESGRLSLRYDARGRWGERVVIRADLDVSAEAFDPEKDMRVVAERKIYREGETVNALLEAPEFDLPVLVTFESDRVVDYLFLSPASLKKTVSFEVKGIFAPNVFLSVGGFSKGRFFSAVDEIVVLRWLDVGIEVTRPSYRPGEKAEIRLTTRDPLGRPVAAELAVSAVDRAIVSLGGPKLSDVRGFFYDRRRRHGVTGSASTKYSYRGQTTPIDVDLLAVEKAKQKSTESEVLEKLLRDAQGLSTADDTRGDALHGDRPEQGGSSISAMGGSRLGRTVPPAARPAAPEAEKKNADRKSTAFATGLPVKDASPAEASADAADGAADPASGSAPLFGALSNGSLEGVDDFERRAAKERNGLFDKSIDAAPALKRILEPGADEPRDDAVRTRFADLAFFDAHVATDQDGKATITIDLPDNLTQWIVTAEGATRSTLVGSASSTVVVKKEIETSIVGPRFLTHKDRTTMRAVATDRAGVERKATIKPTIDGGGARLTPKGGETLDFGPHTSSARAFDLEAAAPGPVTITAQTTSADASDTVTKRLPILAAGARIVGGTSGVLDGKSWADFMIDEEVLPGTGRCEIWISRGIDQDLFEAVLWLAESRTGCIESNIGRFEPAARLAEVHRRLGIALPFSTERLDTLVRSGVESLADSMNADGGVGWWKGGASDLFLTAAAVEALHGGGSVASKKRAAALEAAKLFVLQCVAERRGSLDAQAFGLYALSLLSAAPGEEINRLVRSVRDLGTMGQAWICLAAGRSGREHQAEEVAKRIESALERRGDLVSARGTPHDGWVSSSVEATAWALRALLDRGRRGPTVDGLVAFLRSKKHGPAFGSTKETAAVIDALVEFSAKVGTRSLSGEIAATVNKKPIKRIRIESAAKIGSAVIDVPSDLLLRGQNRVELESTVGEALNFSVLFEGTAVTGDDIAFPGTFRIERRFSEYVPLKDRGRRQKPGYSIIREESRPAVDPPAVVAETDLGLRSTVFLEIECVEDAAYVVIEDPLCAGVDVFEETVRGPHDRFERRDDRMVFYMSAAKKGRYVFEYGIVALHPGEYFVNPPTAFEMYDPRSRGRGVSTRFGIRSRDVVSARVAPPARTPDEVYATGREAILRRDWAAAVAALSPLCDLDLLDDIRGAIMLDLLIARLRSGASAEAVRDHQSLSTLASGGNFSGLTANDVLLLGDAYRAVGDFEMAKSCAAHILRERFTAELRHTRYMERAGRREAAASAALQLAWANPSERAVLDVWAEAAEEFFVCARRTDPAQRTTETTTEIMKSQWERGLKEMRRLLSHNEPTFGDDFGRRYLERLRELGRTADLEREAKSFLERRPDSVHASDAQLMVMKASFLRQDWAAAESAARALTDRSWPTVVDGRIESRPSRHQPEAEHILGRIAHVRGDIETAVARYAKVKDLFADAAQSYAFFVEKRLELPALCEFAPGEECTVPVESKNIARLEGALYGVDLPVVFAVRKSMTRINQVELTGISADRTIELATGAPAYRDTKSSIALGKPDEGAYLLVIGDGTRRSTSLVIVSSLKIDLQRVDQGLRCWVTKRDGTPVAGAEVRIGDGRRIVGSGRTDERGIISFSDVPAGVTALATSGRSFALRRD